MAEADLEVLRKLIADTEVPSAEDEWYLDRNYAHLGFWLADRAPAILAALERVAELEWELADAKESVAWRADWIKDTGQRLERAERLEAALMEIASCELHVPGDVVDVARAALDSKP